LLTPRPNFSDSGGVDKARDGKHGAIKTVQVMEVYFLPGPSAAACANAVAAGSPAPV